MYVFENMMSVDESWVCFVYVMGGIFVDCMCSLVDVSRVIVVEDEDDDIEDDEEFDSDFGGEENEYGRIINLVLSRYSK